MGHYWWLPSIGNVYLERPPWCKQVSFGTFFALVKLFSWKEKNFVYSIWGKKSFLLFHSFCWFSFSPSSPFSLFGWTWKSNFLLSSLGSDLSWTQINSSLQFLAPKKKLKIFLSFFPIFLRPGVPGVRKSGKVGLPSKDLVGRNFCWVMICSLAAFISFSPWNWTSTSLLEPQI